MKTTNQINVGDRVRSFDFENRDLEGKRACYVEGTVEAIGQPPHGFAYTGCDVYTIRVERVVFGGELKVVDNQLGQIVCPPVNGIPKTFGGVTDGVERIEAEACEHGDLPTVWTSAQRLACGNTFAGVTTPAPEAEACEHGATTFCLTCSRAKQRAAAVADEARI